MKKLGFTVVKGLLAGIMIAIAACGYLAVENKYVGSSIFSIGLFAIYFFGFYLYTGKVGYLLEKKNYFEVLIVFFSNIVGTIGCALLLLNTRIVETGIVERTAELASHKAHDGLVSVFILSIFCGMLMCLAAKSNDYVQKTKNYLFGAVVIYLCVLAFLLAGFDHSIANTFYFTLGKVWSMQAVVALIVSALGNAVGGMCIGGLFGIMEKEPHH